MNSFENILSAVRQKRPLVHFITNYVTVNDCANMTLALGGSPIMADDLREVEQIVGHCSALVLNIGTLSERTVQSMLAAGKEANRLGRPVVFDPVGVGASRFRNETAAMLLREVRFDVIKGNISEIAYLAEGIGTTKGVDANLDALSTEGNLRWHTDLARKVSTQTGAAIVISGPIDIVADSHEAWAIRNGHPMMANITGTGCMSAGVIGCCVGADPQALLPSCVCAMSAMGICVELSGWPCGLPVCGPWRATRCPEGLESIPARSGAAAMKPRSPWSPRIWAAGLRTFPPSPPWPMPMEPS